ncbi:hypothetical protein H0H93_007096 [Arthromyces matolae]|nr:hypothetical protein H0H93_007096 [Arthromyces matolae]
MAGFVLLTRADTIATYWNKVFPAWMLLCFGLAGAFVSSNIAMLRTPLLKPGVDVLESTALVGAIFNASLQIGSSVCLAIVTAITNRVNGSDISNFEGYKTSFWFVVGLAAFEVVLSLVSLRGNHHPPNTDDASDILEKGTETIDEKTT